MGVDRIEPINTKHPTLLMVNMTLNSPPLGAEVSLLSLVVVHMLCLYAYPSLPPEGYAKFMIGFDLENPDVTITTGYVIRLYGDNGKLLPISTIYGDIVSMLSEFSRKYEESDMMSIATTPLYHGGQKGEKKVEQKAFVAADLETLITSEGDSHKPYAAGLMLVLLKEPVKYNRVETYFSDDYITIKFFDDRSSKMMDEFLSRIEHIFKGFRSVLKIFFHNLGKFDGIAHDFRGVPGVKQCRWGIFRPNWCAIAHGSRSMPRELYSLNLGSSGIISVIRFNICGHLGGQMGETARTGHFWAKLVCYSPQFRGWDQGPHMLWVKYQLEYAKEVGDYPSVVRFNIRGHLEGIVWSVLIFVAIWKDKQAKRRE
ncbi:hypothetical protein T459_24306 [Capsicum annuum]|uniref:Uncharacterized protein n=1 Tax=Capsicum annuum TaxID=4072 RepID=A0A2G2YV63_CAPAN|nr:hypothetical protein T459_24306 [Capsicum annuum]